MSIRLAINGFGRIGRLSFRKIIDDSNFDIVAINDLASPEMIAYLLKYDTVQGGFHGHSVDFDRNSITVNDKRVTIFSESDASLLPWKESNIDIVLECTGLYTSQEKAESHLRAGAKKVLISAPAGNDVKTIVYGTNHDILTPDDTRYAVNNGITRRHDDNRGVLNGTNSTADFQTIQFR